MPDKDELKALKKISKAEAKAAKKGPSPADHQVPSVSDPGDKSPAQRSAEAAEKQLVLHRWKVIFGAVSALIALVSLIVLLLKG